MTITGISRIYKPLLAWMITLTLLASCDKSPNPIADNPIHEIDSNSVGVYIVNEGNFQWGNASLSYYNPLSNLVQTDIYKAHNGKGIGDVLQSVCEYQNRLYLVVNNSRKISVLDAKTWKETGIIEGFNSPRYILPINENKAYVSDLYENAVYIVNLKTLQIEGKIMCQGWTEEMLLVGNSAFVCGLGSAFVYVIDTQTNKIKDSIDIGFGAQSIIRDAQNKIWVLSIGKTGVQAQLCRMNEMGFVEKRLRFKEGENPGRLIKNSNGNTLFWINKDIYSMDITDSILPQTPFISAQGKNFYAIGYEPYKNEILASDAKDFIQRSEVFRYTQTGQEAGRFHTHINTGNFYARKP